MRVNDDRGMVAVIVAFSLTVLIGAGALAVDLGNVWQVRRSLVTATDASALAAAQDYADGRDDGCSTTAPEYVTANRADAEMTRCTHEPIDGGGIVTVEAEAEVASILADIIGITSTTPRSSTSVAYGAAGTVFGGLRPFGLCVAVLEDLVALDGLYPGDGVTYRVPYGKDAQADRCGGEDVPGNWAILDFDGGANSQQDVQSWVRNGYPGEVSLGDRIEGDTGAISPSLQNELRYLRDNAITFTIPVFDAAEGNGANSLFTISDFAQVRLMGFRVNGAEARRYLDIRIVEESVPGGPGGDTDYGTRVLWICDVDGDDC